MTDRISTADETTTQYRIEKLAYQRWQNAGSPIGDALCFWLTAEKEISEKSFSDDRIWLNAGSPHVCLWP